MYEQIDAMLVSDLLWFFTGGLAMFRNGWKRRYRGTIAIWMFVLLGAPFGATACGVESADSAEGESHATVKSPTTAQPLAVLETNGTRVIVLEDHPGDVMIAEEGAVGIGSVLDGWD